MPRPGYPLLEVLSSFEHLDCVGYSLKNDGACWSTDWNSIEHCPRRTKAILVVDPNNPTGSVFSAQDWKRLVDFCALRKMAIIVDQVFVDFPLQNLPVVDWEQIASRVSVFRLNGMSKCFGLPQAKLSWIWFGCPSQDRGNLQHALEYVADAYLNLSAISESLLTGLVPFQSQYRERVLARVHANWQTVCSLLRPIADKLPAPQAGWYCCVHIDGIDDEAFAIRLAQEYGVLVQPGFFFDFEEDGWIVFSLLAEPLAFSQGVSYLAQAVRSR